MNKHFIKYTGLALGIINAIALNTGNKGNLPFPSLPRPSKYLSKNQLNGAHVAVPAVLAGVAANKLNPMLVNKIEDGKQTWYQNPAFAQYVVATEMGLAGHSIGSAVSLANEKLGNQICYHSHRAPLAIFAKNNAVSFADKAVKNEWVAKTNQNAVAAVLTVAGYLGLDIVVTTALTKAGEKLGLIEEDSN